MITIKPLTAFPIDDTCLILNYTFINNVKVYLIANLISINKAIDFFYEQLCMRKKIVKIELMYSISGINVNST